MTRAATRAGWLAIGVAGAGLLSGCGSHGGGGGGPRPQALAALPGMVGDGVTDDHAALQAALDAAVPGGVVTVPAGRYVIGQAGTAYWGIAVPAGVTLRGEPGAVLVQAPGTPGAVAMIRMAADGAALGQLELDGGKQADSDSHRHGVMVTGANVAISGVYAHGFTGDGIYLYIGAHHARVRGVRCTSNGRNGLTLGGGTTDTVIGDSTFADNRAQNVDSEPVAPNTVDGVLLDHLTIGASASGDWSLTISGSSATTMSRGWVVRDVEVTDGGIFIVWADDVLLDRARVTSNNVHPALTVYRTSRDVRLYDSSLTASAAPAVITVSATAAGPPTKVRIARSILALTGHAGSGVSIDGPGDVEVVDNELRGPGIAGAAAAGVIARTTMPAVDPAHLTGTVIVRRNKIDRWPAGVMVWGAYPLALADVVDNVISDDSGTTRAAVSLNPDLAGAVRSAQVAGNVLIGVPDPAVQSPPAGDHTAWSGDRWQVR